MGKQSSRGTPDEKIASAAKAWRPFDKAAIADKQNHAKQRAEYAKRKDLRKIIDEAEAHT